MTDLTRWDFPPEAEVNPSNDLVRSAVHRAYRGRCFYTGREVALSEMHLDHVIPRAAGGPDNLYNLAVATGPINSSKSDAFDPEGVVPVLYLVRERFAPRALRFLQELRAATVGAAQREAGRARARQRFPVPGVFPCGVVPGVFPCRRTSARRFPFRPIRRPCLSRSNAATR